MKPQPIQAQITPMNADELPAETHLRPSAPSAVKQSGSAEDGKGYGGYKGGNRT